MGATRDDKSTEVPYDSSTNIPVWKSELAQTKQNILGRGAFGVVYLRRYTGSNPAIRAKCRHLTDSKGKDHYFIVEKQPQHGADLDDFQKEQRTANKLTHAYNVKYANVEHPPASYQLQMGAVVVDDTTKQTTPALLGQLEYFRYKEITDENGEIDFIFETATTNHLLEEESKYNFYSFGNDTNLIMANIFASSYASMEDMHEAGMVHLDIALRNEIIYPIRLENATYTYAAKVIDYGFTEELDENGQVRLNAKTGPIRWMNCSRIRGIADKESEYYACRIKLLEEMAILLDVSLSDIISLPSKNNPNIKVSEGFDFVYRVLDFGDENALKQYVANVKEILNQAPRHEEDARRKATATVFLNCFESYISLPNVAEVTEGKISDKQMLAKSYDKLFTASVETALAIYERTKDTDNHSLATLLITLGHATHSPTSWKSGYENSEVYNLCASLAKFPVNSNDPQITPLLIQLQTKVLVKPVEQIVRESSLSYMHGPELNTIGQGETRPEINPALHYGVPLPSKKDEPKKQPDINPKDFDPNINPRDFNYGVTPPTPKPEENEPKPAEPPRSMYGTVINFLNPANYLPFGKQIQPITTKEPEKSVHNSTTDITTKLNEPTPETKINLSTGKKTVRIKDDSTTYAPIPGSIVEPAGEMQPINRTMSADEIHVAVLKNQTIRKNIVKTKSARALAVNEERLSDLIKSARTKISSPDLQRALDTFFSELNLQASISLIQDSLGAETVQSHIRRKLAEISSALSAASMTKGAAAKEQIKSLKAEQETWRNLDTYLTTTTKASMEMNDILIDIRESLNNVIKFDATRTDTTQKDAEKKLLEALNRFSKPLQKQADRINDLFDTVSPGYMTQEPIQTNWLKANIFQSMLNADAQAKTPQEKHQALQAKLNILKNAYPDIANKNLYKTLIETDSKLDLKNHPEQIQDYKAQFIALMHDVINKSALPANTLESIYQSSLPPQKAEGELVLLTRLTNSKPSEAFQKIKDDLINDKYRFMKVRPDLIELWIQSAINMAQHELANNRLPNSALSEEIFDYLAGKNSKYLKLYQQKYKDNGSLNKLTELYQYTLKATADDLFKLSKEIFVNVDFDVKNFTKPKSVANAINHISSTIEKEILQQNKVSKQLLAAERWIAIMGHAFTAHDFQTVQAIFTALYLNDDIKKLLKDNDQHLSNNAKYVYANIVSAMAKSNTINIAAIVEKDFQDKSNTIPTVDYVAEKIAHHTSNISEQDKAAARFKADTTLSPEDKTKKIEAANTFKQRAEQELTQDLQNLRQIKTQLKTNTEKPVKISYEDATKPFKPEVIKSDLAAKKEKIQRLTTLELAIPDKQKQNVQTLIEQTQALTAEENKRRAAHIIPDDSKKPEKEFKKAVKPKEEHREFLFAHERKKPTSYRKEGPLTEVEKKIMKRQDEIQAITDSINDLGDILENLNKSMEQLATACKQIADDARETPKFKMH